MVLVVSNASVISPEVHATEGDVSGVFHLATRFRQGWFSRAGLLSAICG